MRCILLLVLWADAHQAAFGGPDPMECAQGPYDCQVARQLQRLDSGEAKVCAGAAEALRFLRAYSAEQALVERLDDESADVRRQAAMALAWCSSRRCVARLLDVLDDPDWVTRQAAQVSLTNLTGMEFPFHSTVTRDRRLAQANVWRAWWSTVPKIGCWRLLSQSRIAAPSSSMNTTTRRPVAIHHAPVRLARSAGRLARAPAPYRPASERDAGNRPKFAPTKLPPKKMRGF